MPKYLSGRVKKTPYNRLPTDRYEYLALSDAEPNLGDFDPSRDIPLGQQYQVFQI